MAGLGGRQVDDREEAVASHEPRVAVEERHLPVQVGGALRDEDAGAVDLEAVGGEGARDARGGEQGHVGEEGAGVAQEGVGIVCRKLGTGPLGSLGTLRVVGSVVVCVVVRVRAQHSQRRRKWLYVTLVSLP